MNKYLNDPVRQVRKDDLSANLIRMRAVSLTAAGGHRERQRFGSKRKAICCRRAV